jgi:hypothetical protein
MRKFVLVAAMVVVSAGAHAGQVRSLSLAGSDSKAIQDSAKTTESASVVDRPKAPRATEAMAATEQPKYDQPKYDQPKSVEQPKSEERPRSDDRTGSDDRPKFVERPPGIDVGRQPQQPQAAQGAARRRQSAQQSRTGMHRGGRVHVNPARIIAALHRYGIYW